MKKEQKRLFILIAILAGAGIYWLYDSKVGSSGKTSVRQAVVKPMDDVLSSPMATRITPEDERFSITEVIDTVRGWGRDPFQPPEGMELFKIVTSKKGKGAPQPADESLNNVTCIFICGSHKIATLGDMNCCEGDMIGGEKVVEILPDRVILKRGHTKREVLLEDEGVSVAKKVK